LQIRQWVKHFLVYGSGVILMNVVPFVLIPIYTHAVTPQEYGVLELLNRSQELLLLLVSLGLRSTLLTFYQMEKDRPERRKKLYSTALQFLMASSFLMLLVAGMFSKTGSELLFNASGYSKAIILILISTYFESLFQTAALYLQSEIKSELYVTVFASRAVFSVLVNLVLVSYMGWGLYGILWATLTQTFISTALLLVYTFIKTGTGFDPSLARDMMRFGLPLVPGAFAMFALNNGDRYFLNAYATQADVGIYGLGYRLGMLTMSLVLMPFGKIWSATMVDISRQTDGPVRLGRIATYLLAASAFSTLGVSLFSPFALRLLTTPVYWDAYKVVAVVGAAYIFYSWTVIIDASFYITKKTAYKSIILALSCAVVLPMYGILIPRYGTMGAAWATLLGFAAFAAISGFYGQRVYRINYESGRIAGMFAIATALYLLGTVIPPEKWTMSILFRALVSFAYPVVLWVFFATVDERHAMIEYVSSFKKYFSEREAAVAADPVAVPVSTHGADQWPEPNLAPKQEQE
jgi:O-antigen/teichoic acid export membrane protein